MPAAPTAPSPIVATALSSSSIQLTWTMGSSNLTSYMIERSSDGTNFTTIATGLNASTTSYTDNVGLSSATKYYYRITAINATGSSAPSAIVNATTQQLFTVTYVSDLTAVSATTGYGTVQQDKSVNGNPITLNGTVYAKGIGTHAASTITYNLAGKYSYFVSDVGIDAEEDGRGNGYVDFQVWGDGVLLFDSNVLTNDQVAHINVSVAGVQNLQLIASNGVAGTIDYDHADWAGAELLA
ncbi:MAG: NPCBM/NEW2 domain-containing protein [Phycisphaerae bacterium]|nr:NPCBM/NEW2 domain-containing protein [Phycisphaerae bacterium]